MAKRILSFPFTKGQSEAADPKLLNELTQGDGTLKRAINCRLRKDGRIVARRDYDALPMTTNLGGSLVAYDLMTYQGNLMALGDSRSFGHPMSLFDFQGTGQTDAWTAADYGTSVEERRLLPATDLRDLGRLPPTAEFTRTIDVAAAGGFVCIVTMDQSGRALIQLLRAATGQTVLIQSLTNTISRPRVVAIGSVFYIAGIGSGSTSVNLRSLTPSTATWFAPTVAVSTPFAAGATIEAFDMTTNVAGTELIMAVARTTPTSEIRRVNTAGTTLQTIAGPATLMDYVTVYNDGTRIHFVQVNDTTQIVRLSTYLVAGGALENGPTTLFSSGTTVQQASISTHTRSGTSSIAVMAQIAAGATTNVQLHEVTASSHALGTLATYGTALLMSKAQSTGIFQSSVNRSQLFAGRFSTFDDTNFLGYMGTTEVGIAAAKEHNTCTAGLLQLGHLAIDASTSKHYWPQLTDDNFQLGISLISEVTIASTARCQTAELGGHLYLARSATQVYDGQLLVESAFVDDPIAFTTTALTGTGTMALGLYTLAVVFEYEDSPGHLCRSAPSNVVQRALTGIQDAIQIVVSSPHSMRRDLGNDVFGFVRVVVYCSEPDGDQLYRALVLEADPSAFGTTLTGNVTDVPDPATATIIYTQADRGLLSGPLPFGPPLPARFIWASKDRVLLGGLADVSRVQESRALFPNEPISWSLDLGFFANVRGAVTAVALLDERRIVWTASEVFEVPGEGIDDNGNGVFGPPVKLPSDGGCIDWRSVVECSLGIFFQLDTDKLYILPRGGGSPVWIGQSIRDTLATFPVITSATLVQGDQTVCFTCNDSGGTTSRVIVYDLRAGQWFVDEPLSAETLRASASYQNRLAICKGTGAVFQQRSTDTPATFIPMELESNDVYGGSQNGWSVIHGVTVLLEWLGNCNVSMDYSYNSGRTYVAGKVFALSGLVANQRKRLVWIFGRPNMNESVRVRFRTSALSGAATAGVAFITWGLLVEPSDGLPRVAASEQG